MRLLVSAASVVMVGLLAVGTWRAFDAEPAAPAEREATPVTIAQVRMVSGRGVVESTGTLALKRETSLSFKTAGVIAALPVRAGDVVKSGQVLARLDQTEVDARAREARAQLEVARREDERSSELLRRGFVAARRAEDAHAAFERARAAYQVVQFDRQWSELRAPWDGVVLARVAEEGELAAPGKVILTIGDTTGGFNLMAPIADRDVAKLAVGDRAEVTFAATNAPVGGRVARLTAKADSKTGSFEAEIALDAAPAALRSGMIGEASLFPSVGRLESMLAIPAEAIVEGDGERASVYVMKANDDGAELREVQLARLDGALALVRSGLSLSDRVVVSGAAYIHAGEPLRVVDSHSADRREVPRP